MFQKLKPTYIFYQQLWRRAIKQSLQRMVRDGTVEAIGVKYNKLIKMCLKVAVKDFVNLALQNTSLNI